MTHAHDEDENMLASLSGGTPGKEGVEPVAPSPQVEPAEGETKIAWEFQAADGSWKPCRNERDAAMWAEDGRKIRPVPGTIR